MTTLIKTLAGGLALLILVIVSGCGYSSQRLHPAGIKTVSMDIVNRGRGVYRRDIEFRATEAIKKRIEHVTPYKLTSKTKADTHLSASLDIVSQTSLSTNPDTGWPFEKDVTFKVSLKWVDLRTGETIIQRKNLLVTGNYAEHAPIGEDFSQAREQALNKLARRVVELMETPWSPEHLLEEADSPEPENP